MGVSFEIGSFQEMEGDLKREFCYRSLMQHIETFRAGDAVPEWLIAAEPRGPHSALGSFTFLQECALLESDECYWILPTKADGPGNMFSVENMPYCTFRATSKTVRYPTGTLSMYADGRGETINLD